MKAQATHVYREDIVFVAWSRLSLRTRFLAEEIGAHLLFVDGRPPYLENWYKTRKELEWLKPRIVFVQLPQGPLLFAMLRLARRQRFHVIADVHTGFAHPVSLVEKMLNAPFRRLLYRCSLVLAHNEPLRDYLLAKSFSHTNNTIVVYDPVGRPQAKMEPYEYVKPGQYILVPASWAYDEPLEFIVREYTMSRIYEKWGYKLVITGNHRRREKLAKLIANVKGVILTGFAPDTIYHWLVANAALVIVATTREYTMLRAVWDAALHETPVVVSRTKTLEVEVPTPCMFDYREGSLASILEPCIENEEWRSQTKQTLRELKKKSIEKLENLKARLKKLLET